ncbi:hypothetical protein DJ90_5933 [Paenibacillus macerans]|uniref:Uncharacterized protein n=1 Tax=Paenibacillus macerans TaxID=44252 RepID=A0A090Y7F5_PAEMA|nr:hypothetical protein DJ90_5933 [Paenibacillus macerans]
MKKASSLSYNTLTTSLVSFFWDLNKLISVQPTQSIMVKKVQSNTFIFISSPLSMVFYL